MARPTFETVLDDVLTGLIADETSFLECKGYPDINDSVAQGEVARAVLAMANRPVSVNEGTYDGYAYVVVGADHSGISGTKHFDVSTVEQILEKYIGVNRVQYRCGWISKDSKSVLVIEIFPSSNGMLPVVSHKEIVRSSKKKAPKGTVFVRQGSKSSVATQTDMDNLVKRANERYLYEGSLQIEISPPTLRSLPEDALVDIKRIADAKTQENVQRASAPSTFAFSMHRPREIGEDEAKSFNVSYLHYLTDCLLYGQEKLEFTITNLSDFTMTNLDVVFTCDFLSGLNGVGKKDVVEPTIQTSIFPFVSNAGSVAHFDLLESMEWNGNHISVDWEEGLTTITWSIDALRTQERITSRDFYVLAKTEGHYGLDWKITSHEIPGLLKGTVEVEADSIPIEVLLSQED